MTLEITLAKRILVTAALIVAAGATAASPALAGDNHVTDHPRDSHVSVETQDVHVT
ncbi:hypothetical protein AB0P17_12065 [Streptomyces sp. NPDC088124]|uniref:hypothetical protein n=1 Tax=Streptomyces sp. NPDC088124 TaxID=3154654 RepID=UPI0034200BEF